MDETKMIRHFWEWVTIHEADLVSIADNPAGHAESLAHLQSRLQAITPGLVCDLGLDETGQKQLIISAEGDQSLFPSVIRIVSEAPTDLLHFQVVAFRPAVPGHAAMVLDGFRLASDQLMCRVRKETNGKVAVDAFVQDYDKDDERYDLLVRLLMMHALGEYGAVTKVKYLHIHPWPLPHQAEGLIPWVRLNRTVAELCGKN